MPANKRPRRLNYAVNKKNLPAGERLKLRKYSKQLRKHVEYTFVDAK